MTTDRKVLIVSYLWPPMEGVGLVRALKFAKYLPSYGWKPVILTVHGDIKLGGAADSILPDVKVYRTAYKDIIAGIKNTFQRRIFCDSACAVQTQAAQEAGRKRGRRPSVIRELISIPDEQRGWYSFGVEEGRRILAEESIDAIFSTSPPETSHLIARALKKASGLPWIADLRDLWADDHFRVRPPLKRLILGIMEKRVLSDADAVVTVSEPWAKTLRASIGGPGGKVRVIENAYDEDDFMSIGNSPGEKFTITYTGKIHQDRQPLDIFFKALRSLITEKRIDRDKIRVIFYALGYDKPDIEKMAVLHGLGGIVEDLGGVGYRRSLEVQRYSGALLFVQWQGRGDEGWYSAKLYDYIGARRPIIALGRKGSIIDDLIRKTSSGVVAETEEEARRAISGLYDEFVRRGRVSYAGNEPEIARLSRKLRTGELADLLDRLVVKERA